MLENCTVASGYIHGHSIALNRDIKIESKIAVPFLKGKEIRRYETLTGPSYLISPYDIKQDKSRLLTDSEFQSLAPLAYNYLQENKSILTAREKGKFKGENWYAFGYPKSMTLFQKNKIVVPDYNNKASFTIDDQGFFYKTGYGIILKDSSTAQAYILGLLNSKLLFKHLLKIGTSLRGGYVRFWTKYIEQLPIRAINFSDPTDKARHDKMVTLVERMLKLHKDLQTEKLPDKRTQIERTIQATDREIDALVYELYGLTEEEIKIVEGTA